MLVLEGAELDTDGVSNDALAAWAAAGDRLGAIDEERRLPYLLVAVPTAERAAALDLILPELDAALVPALAANTTELRRIHGHGCLLVSFGENRYLGGENASSLNVDFALPVATLLVDDRVVVDAGVVVA